MDKLNVLIVEDSLDDADLVSRQLTLAGFDAHSMRVETEEQFRHALDTQPWDLIFSDFQLRSFSGFRALELFQAFGADIPFIMISGTVGEDIAVDAMRRGVSDYLMKGNLARLAPVVERELRDSAHRRERRVAENALKESEAALRQSEENFRALVQATTQFVWTADANGSSEALFAWFSKMYERPVNSVPEILALMHPDDAAAIEAEWATALNNRMLLDRVCRFVKNDGSIVYLAARCVPIFDEDGLFRNWIGTFTDITERMAGQLALRASETQLRTIVESVPECVKLLDTEGRILKINRSGIELLEADSFDELRGRPVAELITEEFRDAFIESTKEVVSGNPGQMQFEIVGLKGTRRWMDMKAVPIRDNENRVVAVLDVSRDETDRRKSDEALRISEERFRDLFENANDLIYTHDLQGNFTSLNRAGELITGYSRDEAANLSLKDVVAPEYLQLASDRIREKMAGGEATTYETEIITKDGRRVMLDLSTRLIFENGKPSAIQGIARDITERRRTELAIRSNELQLRVVTNTIPVAITYTGADGILRFANRAFLEWIGKGSTEVVGRHIQDLLGEKGYRQIVPEFERVLGGEHFDVERYSYINPTANINGPQPFVRMNYVPEFAPSGEVVAFFAFMTDLTESKNAELALRKSEEQLLQSQKLESVGRLAGGIAHDFNNMLTAINGYSELTLRRMHPSDPLRGNIEEIKKAGERSAELTNQLLAFSRRQIMKPRVLELNRAVSDLVPMLERLIGEDVQLRTAFSTEKGMINADPGQLSQVLLNLVINARDSMPDGGSILIETFEQQIDKETIIADDVIKPGEYYVLAISDTGVGMDEQTIQHIFEPFFTTKEVGKGTGLGLSTVYGIVHQSGGNIKVSSMPGKGARFEIYLPAVGSNLSSALTGKSPGSMSSGTETILLVEDEQSVRDLSREVLESCGYTVVTAKDGINALEILEEKGKLISLILTDVVMPNMGGRELAEETKKRFPKIKVLFSSGYDNRAIVDNGAFRHGTNFIQKPFTFDALALKIRELLDQK